jgi:phosphopantothenoylcysteine decarboxylase/phosphopantothenate--cysteine ligase
MSLEAKTIILCISGGIAAYKTPDLVSQLRKCGANVHVVVTESAQKFVSTLSLEVMSANKVHSKQNEGCEIEHIELADKADLILIAPATANTMAKLTTGISDDILYDLVLATRAPILIAPAMNSNMWEHATVQRNRKVLETMNYHFVEPEFGELACGHIGQGRLAEIDTIINAAEGLIGTAKKPQSRSLAATKAQQEGPLEKKQGSFIFNATRVEKEPEEEINPNLALLQGRKIIITVGATREKIDPVRFITNRSSGKMGFALAREAVKYGADVKLISTIDNTESWTKDLELIRVETHREMYEAIFEQFVKASPYSKPADALIMVAAVSDYRPREISDQKLKSNKDSASNDSQIGAIVNMINEANARVGDLTIQLEKTPDILQEISKLKQASQAIVGFSVETENLVENARNKIRSKRLDFIVANSPEAFGADEAEVSIIASDLRADCMPMISSIPKESKNKIALKVLEYLGLCLHSSDLQHSALQA